jgi:hypothetical protein
LRFEFLLWLRFDESLFEMQPKWFGFTISTDLLPICFSDTIIDEFDVGLGC